MIPAPNPYERDGWWYFRDETGYECGPYPTSAVATLKLLEYCNGQSEIERLRVALKKIVEFDHYPDANIARRALGLPVTPREHIGKTSNEPKTPQR